MAHKRNSVEVPELEKLLAGKKKKYVRYEEGAVLYSMGKNSFRQVAQDEAPLKKEIYEQIRYYVTTSVARRIEHIMQAIKLACASEPPEIQTDRIHVRNGTYFADGHFTPEKEYCKIGRAHV